MGAMMMHCLDKHVSGLANEVVTEVVDLSGHTFGNCVVQHVLEYGTPSCRSSITRRLATAMPSLVMNRIASRVVEKALELSDQTEQYLIAEALLQTTTPISMADVA